MQCKAPRDAVAVDQGTGGGSFPISQDWTRANRLKPYEREERNGCCYISTSSKAEGVLCGACLSCSVTVLPQRRHLVELFGYLSPSPFCNGLLFTFFLLLSRSLLALFRQRKWINIIYCRLEQDTFPACMYTHAGICPPSAERVYRVWLHLGRTIPWL